MSLKKNRSNLLFHIQGRFTVPTYINNSSKNTEKLANPKEAFFEELGCNDNQRFFMGGHMPPEDISNESLKHWKGNIYNFFIFFLHK